jgi:hypothetical protein
VTAKWKDKATRDKVGGPLKSKSNMKEGSTFLVLVVRTSLATDFATRRVILSLHEKTSCLIYYKGCHLI